MGEFDDFCKLFNADGKRNEMEVLFNNQLWNLSKFYLSTRYQNRFTISRRFSCEENQKARNSKSCQSLENALVEKICAVKTQHRTHLIVNFSNLNNTDAEKLGIRLLTVKLKSHILCFYFFRNEKLLRPSDNQKSVWTADRVRWSYDKRIQKNQERTSKNLLREEKEVSLQVESLKKVNSH